MRIPILASTFAAAAFALPAHAQVAPMPSPVPKPVITAPIPAPAPAPESEEAEEPAAILRMPNSVRANTLRTATTRKTYSPANCYEMQTYANSPEGRAMLLDALNSELAGQENRINDRKTLVIHSVSDVGFRGCEATVRHEVTLKRKIRKDADGHITTRYRTTFIEEGAICLKDARIVDIGLSNMRGIGEEYIASVLLGGGEDGERCRGRLSTSRAAS